jgi:hypothetical protein
VGLSWLTNSALVYEPKCGGGRGCGVSANEYSQGDTKTCRLSLRTNSVLVSYTVQGPMRGGLGGGGGCRVSANEYNCAHHVTWSPNKLWRSISIFNLLVQLYTCAQINFGDVTPYLTYSLVGASSLPLNSRSNLGFQSRV